MAADITVVTETKEVGQLGGEEFDGIVSGECYSLVSIRRLLSRHDDEDAAAVVAACEALWDARGWDKWRHAILLVD